MHACACVCVRESVCACVCMCMSVVMFVCGESLDLRFAAAVAKQFETENGNGKKFLKGILRIKGANYIIVSFPHTHPSLTLYFLTLANEETRL